jgi:CubicO group peptidase (beta-lactamase class C family)
MWWLNRAGRYPDVPVDCFACEGYEGQYIWVIPSKDLVIVRLARETGRRLDPDRFVQGVVAAMR